MDKAMDKTMENLSGNTNLKNNTNISQPAVDIVQNTLNKAPSLLTDTPSSTNLDANLLVSPTSTMASPVKIEPFQTIPPSTPVNYANQILEALNLDEKTDSQKLQENLIQNQINAILSMGDEEGDLLRAREQYGVGDLRKDLQSINSQILVKQQELAKSDIELIDAMRREENRDTLLPFAQMGQAKLQGDAQIARALKNAEIGVLSAQAVAKQGDVTLAMDLAQQAVDQKYAPYKRQIEQYTQVLSAIAPLLTADEKRQATKQQIKIDSAWKEIEKAENNDKAISDIVVNAAAQGAPQSLISQAQTAKTLGEAAKILGQWAGDYYKTELLKSQLQTEKLQQSKIRADLAASASGTTTQAAQTPEVQAWVKNINSDKAKLSDVPANIKNAVALGLANSESLSPAVTEKINASQAVYDLAETLKTMSGKSASVGFGIGKSLLRVEEPIAGTSRANYTATFNQLKDSLASANLDKLKGAMSDKDIEFLRNVATSLNLNMSEKAFDAELKKIQETAKKVPGVGVSATSASNPFNQALGNTTNTQIPGASIVSSVSDSGDVNFILPTTYNQK